jgi:hypothetical protein
MAYHASADAIETSSATAKAPLLRSGVKSDSVAKSNEGRELAELNGFLRGEAEQLADEFNLGHHISFDCPSRPTHSDHAHRLNATQGPPRCPHPP